jgi:hypothetical protein
MKDYHVILFLLGVVYWKARNMYYNHLELQFRYKLQSLRDQLRAMVLDNRMNQDDILFEYIDTSISKAMRKVASMHLLIVFILSIKHHKNKEFLTFNKRIQERLKTNPNAAHIYKEYGSIIIWFFFKKHFIIKSVLFVFGILLASLDTFTSKRAAIQEVIENFRVYPETSTVRKYFKMDSL